MVLCYRINQTANIGDFEVTVANFAQRSERNQLTSWIAGVEGVDTTVEAIRKDDEAVRNCVCSSAVLMDTSADIRQTDTINSLFLFLRQILTNIQRCRNKDYDTDGDVLRIGAYTKVL